MSKKKLSKIFNKSQEKDLCETCKHNDRSYCEEFDANIENHISLYCSNYEPEGVAERMDISTWIKIGKERKYFEYYEAEKIKKELTTKPMQEKCKKECEDCQILSCGLPHYKYPCSWYQSPGNNKVQEKSVVEDWESRFDEMLLADPREDDRSIKDFILSLQKETDDKWLKKIEEILKELEETKKTTRGYKAKDLRTAEIMECYFRNGVNQATNIIKELVK